MADGELLTQFFPRGPYAFDSVPTNLPQQPLRAVMTVVEGALLEAAAIMTNLLQQMTVQTATGPWLRNHAVLYGVTPIPGETDDELRMRVLAAIWAPKCTVPACQAYLQGWFNANYTDPPTVYVCDLQTDPVTSAAYGLVTCEFLVLLNWQMGIDDAWFLDYSYLNYTTWLGMGLIFRPPSSLDTWFMTRVKAAGFLPVWRNNITYGYPEGQVGIADDSSITVDA